MIYITYIDRSNYDTLTPFIINARIHLIKRKFIPVSS